MDFTFNFLTLIPNKLDPTYVLQQLQQLIPTANKNDLAQLTQGIPYSTELQLTSATARIIFQARILGDLSVQQSDLVACTPSVILLLIPKDSGFQSKIASTLKSNMKLVKSLKMVPVIALMSDKGFEIQNVLLKQLTEARITTELNANIMHSIGDMLIKQRQAFRKQFLDHLGEDYSLTQAVALDEKNNCSGM